MQIREAGKTVEVRKSSENPFPNNAINKQTVQKKLVISYFGGMEMVLGVRNKWFW